MGSTDANTVIEVADEGGRRRVRVLMPQEGFYRYDDFATDWPAEALLALAGIKREWFADAYARFEHPNYVQKHVDIVRRLYGVELAGKRILDFGCGTGASSYCLVKRGADNVTATDLSKEYTDFARMFFDRRGLGPRVDVRDGDIVGELGSGEYDVIWLQAVVEHLLPGERPHLLRRLWNALRPGGILVITETPNRFWPRETHTTKGTWFLPWMSAERVFRAMRRREDFAGYSDEDLYRSGVIGSTYPEIMAGLGRPADCEELARGVPSYVPVIYGYREPGGPLGKIAARAFGLAEPALKLASRRPAQAFLPFLNHLAFRKTGAAASGEVQSRP